MVTDRGNKKTEFREQDFALLSDTNCFCCLRQGDGKAEAAEGQTAGEATEGGGDCWVSVRDWGGGHCATGWHCARVVGRC